MKRFLLISALGFMAFGISACGNTLDGAGRDIEKAGRNIQDTF